MRVTIPRKFAIEAAVICAYTVITFVFFLPAVMHLTDRIFGADTHCLDWSWNFWYFKRALFETGIRLYRTDLLFWPQGADLYFHTFSLVNCVLYVALSPVMSPATAYNVLMLATFVVAAYGTYRLCVYVIGDRRAAFVSGMLYSFSAYHLIHAYYHMNTSSIQWLPFLVLFFLRTLRERGAGNPMLAAVFFVLNALSCWYYLVFSLFLLPLLWIFARWKSPSWFTTGHPKRTATFFALSLVPMLVLALPVLLQYRGDGYMVENDVSLWYSADIFSYVLPSPWARLLPRWLRRLPSSCGMLGEQILTPGYVAWGLVIFLFWKGRRTHQAVWIWPAVFFGVLSLGPFLRVCGKWYITWTDWEPIRIASDFLRDATGGLFGFDFRRYALPLPGLLVGRMPVLDVIRVPGRYGLVVILCMSVMAGMGLVRLNGFLRMRFAGRRWLPSTVAALCCMFIFVEQWTYPFPSQDTNVPAVYQKIAADPNDVAVFEVPSEHWETQARYIHFQTAHGKKIAKGIVSRQSPSQQRFLETDTLALLLRGERPLPDTCLNRRTVSRFANTGYRYIVVHWDWLDQHQPRNDPDRLREFLDRQFGSPENHDGASLYRVEVPLPRDP
ncbi:MAG: hypothetical protein GF418_06550 [Chitinivibrionales bacterium]|nr:hypothetical protein [Chitinivibrionales bacterium]MBD3395270.1 hypothetical protein [Chitinivibrionales bacterium]